MRSRGRSRPDDHSIPASRPESCTPAPVAGGREECIELGGQLATTPPEKSVLGSASLPRSASAMSLARNPATGGFDQVGDRRGQGDPRAPAGRDEADRGDRRVDDVAWPAGAVVASERRPERPLDLVGECVDRGALTGGDVPRAHRRVRSAKQPQGLNDVEDVDEVPRLRAVAMDRQAALGDRLVDEGRDDRPLESGALAQARIRSRAGRWRRAGRPASRVPRRRACGSRSRRWVPRGRSPSPAARSRHRRRRPRRRRRAGSHRPRVRRPRPDGCRSRSRRDRGAGPGPTRSRSPAPPGGRRRPAAMRRTAFRDRATAMSSRSSRTSAGQDPRIARRQVVDDQDVDALRDQAVHQVAADEARSSGDDRPLGGDPGATSRRLTLPRRGSTSTAAARRHGWRRASYGAGR